MSRAGVTKEARQTTSSEYNWIDYELQSKLRVPFFCRGPISNPRPVLISLAQTKGGMLLDFFCKTSKWAFLRFLLVFFFSSIEKKWFRGGFRHCIDPLISKLIFSEPELCYKQRASL